MYMSFRFHKTFLENVISRYFNNSSTNTEYSSDQNVGEHRGTQSPYLWPNVKADALGGRSKVYAVDSSP